MIKDDALYCDHVIETMDVIFSYTKNISRKDFLENKMLTDAVMRNLQILSESTQKISQKTKDKRGNIPWKDISGFRNILVHDYFEGIDLNAIWNVVVRDLPVLHKEFLTIKETGFNK